MINHMAFDQHGQTYHNLGAHPRKELLARLGRKHASPLYCTIKGKPHKIGWVIGGLWLSVWRVTPMYDERE